LETFCSKLRLDMALEKRAQADLESALHAAGLEFEREKPLSKRDIPDFLVKVEGDHRRAGAKDQGAAQSHLSTA